MTIKMPRPYKKYKKIPKEWKRQPLKCLFCNRELEVDHCRKGETLKYVHYKPCAFCYRQFNRPPDECVCECTII